MGRTAVAYLSHGAPHGALHGTGSCTQPFHVHSEAQGMQASLHFFRQAWWSHIMRQGLLQGGQGEEAWQGWGQSWPQAIARWQGFRHETCLSARSPSLSQPCG